MSELATHALGNLPAVFILDNVHLMDKMSWKLLIQVNDLFALPLVVVVAVVVVMFYMRARQMFVARAKA